MPASVMSEQKARMVHGQLYRADDAELTRDRQRCRTLLERFNASSATEVGARRTLLHEILGHLGTDSVVAPRLDCDYGYQIRIGDRTFINYNAVILDCAAVTIGTDVQIGPCVQLLTASHPLEASLRRTGREWAEPITIGYGAWLGGGVVVCPGVTIGDEAVVAAGSVVTADVAPRALVGGNPAHVLRQL